MSTSDQPEATELSSVDLPVPLFESYGVADYRGGKILTGPLNPYYASSPEELKRALRSVPGDHHLETVDGRPRLTLNIYCRARPRYWLHALLFVATLITTTVSGAVQRSGQFLPGLEVTDAIFGYIVAVAVTMARLMELIARWGLGEITAFRQAFGTIIQPLAHDTRILAGGLVFSLTLLAILGAHELAHYFAARRRGIRASLPYFIPLPFLIGTLGALIRVRSPFVNRRALLEVGIAGPLASFVLSTIAIVVGLFIDARVGPEIVNRTTETVAIHESLLTYIGVNLKFNVGPHQTVYIGQLFWAGWIGLFVTMLNLLPLGQLDGGHVLYALGAKLHQRVQPWLLLAMFAAGLAGFIMNTADGLIRAYPKAFLWLGPIADATPPVWPGWLFWALAVKLVIRTMHPPVLDQDVTLGGWRTALALVGLIILVLTFLPNPFSIIPPPPPIPPGGIPI